MKGRRRYDINRGVIFVDLVNLRFTLDQYRRYGHSELLNDVLAKLEDPDALGLDRVVCQYLFGTYENPHYPTLEEMRMRRDPNLRPRMEAYSSARPYDWADIERKVVASSGEWDVAVLLSSSHQAFELEQRIREDKIPGLKGKEVVVVYSDYSVSRFYAGNGNHNSEALERLFPAWNTTLTSSLQPLSR